MTAVGCSSGRRSIAGGDAVTKVPGLRPKAGRIVIRNNVQRVDHRRAGHLLQGHTPKIGLSMEQVEAVRLLHCPTQIDPLAKLPIIIASGLPIGPGEVAITSPLASDPWQPKIVIS